ncbi:hypothetical protein ACFO3O_17425 [Dokdonia ponticola]|uniref:Uncharacterized protein n=1 Tax=Dokdonia ponticola TaxID=2041041 RepID=A0ABV9HZV8_9FLAO
MKKITHELYIDKHALEILLLPSDIQDKIGVFKKMLALEKSIEEQDAQELENQLRKLDAEILTDIKHLKEIHKEHKGHTATEKVISPKPDTQKKSQYEDILQRLIDEKKHKNVLRSTLRKRGITFPLSKVTTLGKYCITRTSFFSYRYTISVVST